LSGRPRCRTRYREDALEVKQPDLWQKVWFLDLDEMQETFADVASVKRLGVLRMADFVTLSTGQIRQICDAAYRVTIAILNIRFPDVKSEELAVLVKAIKAHEIQGHERIICYVEQSSW